MLIKITTEKNGKEFIHYCREEKKDSTVKNLRLEKYKIKEAEEATEEDLSYLDLVTSKPENIKINLNHWRGN